jgi:hypothetical protein
MKSSGPMILIGLMAAWSPWDPLAQWSAWPHASPAGPQPFMKNSALVDDMTREKNDYIFRCLSRVYETHQFRSQHHIYIYI